MQRNQLCTYVWEGQRFETRSLGIVEVVRTDERSSSVIIRSWGCRLPLEFGGAIDMGGFGFSVPLDQLSGDIVRELARGADLGGSWLDVSAVTRWDRQTVGYWLSRGAIAGQGRAPCAI